MKEGGQDVMNSFNTFCEITCEKLGRPLIDKEIQFLKWLFKEHMNENVIIKYD